MTRHWSGSWFPVVRWTCWIYVLNSARSLQPHCTKWFRYAPAYWCTPSAFQLKLKLLIFFCYSRVIPQVTTVKPCCCCVVVMMHKPCRPLCLGQIPWLPSQGQLCGTRARSPSGPDNHKNMTFQIYRRISYPAVKMLRIAQIYLISIQIFAFMVPEMCKI